MSVTTIGTTAVYIDAGAETGQRKTVKNVGGSALYYKTGTSVSSTSNDGSLASGDSVDITKGTSLVSALQTNVDIRATVDAAEAYSGNSSHQAQSEDLTLDAGAGKSTGSAYLATAMWNLLGASLTKTKNYLAGVIGAYSVTGTKATTYPAGAVLGQITDGVTEADGAFVAYIDGDDSQTNATAAFKVMSNNSTAASGFSFGLDLQSASHDGYNAVDSAFYKSAVVRLTEDICLCIGTSTPTNGTTGANVAGKGSLHLNTSDGKLRTNTNTKASPTWTIVGTQS